jgi:transcriptional regulator with XRE-family HTH domain
MTPSRQDSAPESIGALLTRIRLASGRSQLRVAELLCAASGAPTVTRHEVSRWEREERIPGAYWLRWLAVVLDAPLDDLERAVAASRIRPPDGPPDGAAARRTDDPLGVAALRRMDDLVGGVDLTDLVSRRLAEALGGAGPGPRLLPAVAELAQLACWVSGDAGAYGAARWAHRAGVEAATAAGAYALAGHLVATMAHLRADHDPRGAAELARQAYALARPTASATVRALLLHRVAFTAAGAGQRRVCERALAAAERAYEHRDPGRDPRWVYWFDDAELTAMTGRCFAALGRPRIAEPLLRAALDDDRIRLRARAVYAAWLAAVHLRAGEVEQACAGAEVALLTAVRVGSVRALHQVTALHPGLRRRRDVPAVRRYRDAYRAAKPYLPAPAAGRCRPAAAGEHAPGVEAPGATWAG